MKFEGHEREDVVEARKKFVSYFLENKDYYFYPTSGLNWNIPMRKPRIVLSHDESTFRSGDIPKFRWIFPDIAPFFNKGKGRSLMVSAFIVQHSSCDIFKLDQTEWSDALRNYPELNDPDEFLNYFLMSPNAWIEPKKDNYFDNDVILKQFERLFILLKFKKAFMNCQIEVIVDNATTHSSKVYDINQFNKFPGSQCIYSTIEWNENEEKKM